MKRFLLLFVALALSIGLWAATQTVTYRYPVYKTAGDPASGIASWATASVTATEVTNSTTTLSASSGWYVVTGTDVKTSTLTCTGAVNLILADGAKLTATGKNYQSGIKVAGARNSLTIYAQSTDPAQMGTLIATGAAQAAGIGCGNGSSSGSNITINGGAVTANGGNAGAGIGGGNSAIGSNIIINGGTVTANGGNGAAGIGGGFGGIGSDIIINGGTVTANAGSGSAGIGGGNTGGASNIFVATTLLVKAEKNTNPPATVIANDGSDLAQLLAGKRYVTIGLVPFSYLAPVYNTEGNPASGILRWDTLSCTDYTLVENTTTTLNAGWYVVTGTDVQTGNLTCNGAVNLILADGAKLTATGVQKQAGITVSGEGNSFTVYAQSTDIAQMGTLIANNEYMGAGIGGGHNSSGSNITINGGTVTANGRTNGAGIGGGSNASGFDITINGGIVTANSPSGGAGIGGGSSGSGYDITINGGTVNAYAFGGGFAAGIGGGMLGNGYDITINGGSVTANGGDMSAGIGGGYEGSGSDITVATTLIVKADGNNPPTTVITNDGNDLANSLSGKQYVTIEPAPAVSNNLTDIINSELIGKNSGDTVVLDLSNTIDYVISNPVDLGLVNIIINGNGAKVTLADSTQIAGQQRIEINNVNFDCAANTKLAPIALSANPDSAVHASKGNFYGNKQNVFVDTCAIVLNGCNFAQLSTSLFSNNAAAWVLGSLTINNCVVQFSKSNTKPYIDFGSAPGNVGAIKNFTINASTLFNISIDDAYFIKFANASNGQASKAFPADPHEYITFTNNTFVNICTMKNFGNNTQNNNGFVDEVKGNVFFNVFRLIKYFQTNNTFNFTVADNAINGNIVTIDGSDKANIATEDTALVLTLPTGAFDFNVEALAAYFTPSATSYAGKNGFGDPRWVSTPTPAPAVTEVYIPTDGTGVAKSEWGSISNQAGNIVDIDATPSVHLYAMSGPETGWTEGSTLPLTPVYDNGWTVRNNRNNVWDDSISGTKTLYFVNGKGTPTTGIAFAAQNDGTYRVCYNKQNDPTGPWYAEDGTTELTGDFDFTYKPDGSNGMPKYGPYYKLTSKHNGTMKVLVWNNKGSRPVYVVDNTTHVALNPLTGEVQYSGYVNGKDEYIDPVDESRGKKMIFYDTLAPQTNNPYCPQAQISTNQVAWVYLTFSVNANKTYWIFNNDKLGFGGFEFTPASVPAPTSVIVSADVNDETMGSVNGAGEYMIDEEVTLTAIPEENYHFVNWNSGSTENPLIFNAEKDTAFTANFEGDPHTITVLPSDSARGVVEGTGVYNYGDTATLVATGIYPYQFAYWEDESHTESDTLKVKVLGDSTFTAIFKLGEFDVTAAANDPAMGTVTGGGTYVYDTIVNITAIPNEHYHFVHWNNGSVNPNATVVVRFDTTLTATFAIDQHVVRTDVNNNTLGTVAGAGTYNYGATATLTATPAAHAVFTGWSNGATTATINITVVGDTTVTAMFAADTHTIAATADPTMGSVTGAGEYVHGTLATLTATANEHYHFVNWSNGLTVNTFSILVDNDSTVTANFAIDQHVVTVNANDNALGTVEGTGPYVYGATATLIATPADHAVFIGWSNGETDDITFIVVEGDTTVTAMFAADTHTIAATADPAMGSVTGAGEYVHGTLATLTAVANAHYHFVNWSNGLTVNTFSILVDNDSTVTATFAIDQHVVRTDVNNNTLGTVAGAGAYNYGEEVTLTATPAAHAVFTGWSNGETDATITITLAGDTTVTAMFAADTHTIAATADPAMGSVTGAGEYVHGTLATLTAVANAHYHFVNWSNGLTVNTFSILVDNDSTVTANFAIDQHVVTANVNNNALGTVAGAGAYNYGATATLTATAAAHAVFTGWSNGATTATINITVAGDTTVTAMFAADTHTIAATADPTMGSVTGAGEYVHGTLATLTATANDHYHFVNWSNGLTVNTFSILVDNDSTVTANFAIDQHVVTANVNNNALGTVAGAGTYNYGATATLTATPAAHAVFTGWSNGATTATITITLAGDTTVTAIFAADTHTIAATANDAAMGSVTGAGTYTHGTLATLTATANEHYHFVNWSNGLTVNIFSILVDKDSTVVANFATDQHVVTVNANDNALGTVAGAGAYNYGATATLIATPAAHAVFTGWSNGATTPTINITVAGDTTVTANFIADSHTIAATADPTMGSVTGAGEYVHGTLATLTAVANAHYHFVNWSNGITSNSFSILVDRDSAVTANFAIDQHNVSAIVNNQAMGSVTGAGMYNYGATATLTAVPAAHHHFVNWNTGSTDLTKTISVSDDTTLFASFAIDQHSVTLTSNDASLGTVVGAGTYDYGTNVSIAAVPAAYYVSFAGWSNGLTTPAAVISLACDTSLKATFVLNDYDVTLNVNDDDMGTVTGAGTYTYGQDATLTAIPADCHHFVRWNDGVADATRTYTVTNNLTLTAIFAIDSYTIDVTSGDKAGGKVYCDRDGSKTAGVTVNCGTPVEIHAEASTYYHFVEWSDGIADAIRSVDVTSDTDLVAIFAPDCGEYAEFPVVFLYNGLVMIDLDSVKSRNYNPSPDDVTWYQVSGDVDDLDAPFPSDDREMCNGYYLSLPTNNVGYGQYYAVVNVSGNSPEALCHGKMKSVVVDYTNTASSKIRVDMTPTRVKGGEVMTITGLVASEMTTITVVDYTGKTVGVMQTEGLESYDLTAYAVPGIYMVRITSESVSETVKYIVTK